MRLATAQPAVSVCRKCLIVEEVESNSKLDSMRFLLASLGVRFAYSLASVDTGGEYQFRVMHGHETGR